VHLIPLELLAEVSEFGRVKPGDLGENVTTIGIDLKKLGKETKLLFVDQEHGIHGNGDGDCDAGPVVVVMGLRNPCPQIDKFRSGLRERLLVRDEERRIVGRLAGVMGTVEKGGEIRPGMTIRVQQPAEYQPLECV
jgi:MOSC domain-containing protein YiiM